MITKNVIIYKPEYILDEDGHRIRFKVDKDNAFVLKDGTVYNPESYEFREIEFKQLIVDNKGKYFRQIGTSNHRTVSAHSRKRGL